MIGDKSRNIDDIMDCYPSGPTKIPFTREQLFKDRKGGPPTFLNPFAVSSSAIFCSYFNVGIGRFLLLTPVAIYLVNTMNVSSTLFSAYNAVLSIPWSFKFVIGMMSDALPIYGYRRKVWFVCAWISYVVVSLCIAFTGPPSVDVTISLMLLLTVLYLISDVVTDCFVIDRQKYEVPETQGSFQSSGYAMRAFGCVVGASLGAVLYNTSSWGWGLTINQIFLLNGLIPLTTIIPVIPVLEEIASLDTVIPTFREIFSLIWGIIQLRSMHQPLTFIFVYNIFQIPNGAFNNFLLVGLNFSGFEFGMITVAGAGLGWVGIVVYKYLLFNSSWRMIYVYTTLIALVFSLLQIVLILRVNDQLGIPDFFFTLSGNAVMMFVGSIQFMPGAIFFAMICPDGFEGVVYSLFITANTLGSSIAQDLSSCLTLIWDVSNGTIRGGDYTGVLYLAILTSILQVVPLAIVWLLPDSKLETRQLLESEDRNTCWGGILLVSAILCLFGTITLTIVFIFFPV